MMAAAAPAPAPAALTDAARGLLLQWLQARCQQQKHRDTSFELLVDRVQALHTDSITRLDAVRIARLFMADAYSVLG